MIMAKKPAKPAKPKPRRSVAELEARLREAEDTLEAIRQGHVDALVVQGPEGDRVFTLEGADHRYRQLVETMTEGALLVAADDTILYANARFAELVDCPLEKLIATRLDAYVAPSQRLVAAAVLRAAAGPAAKAEVQLVSGSRLVPVYLSATLGDDASPTCVIVTDLSDQKRNQALFEAEQLTAQVVDQSTDGIVVCDVAGRVVRASRTAQRVASANPFLKPFDETFELGTPNDPHAGRAIVVDALAGRTTSGIELRLISASGEPRDLLLSAGPITHGNGAILGCVVSFVDITERKRVGEERDAARVEAEAANRAKDEFLAMLGHELRNPLAPILTALDLMKLKGDTTAERERAVIERHVKDVVRLVGDLLDVSRIAQGKVELDRKPVELASIVDQAVESASPLIEDREHHLSIELEPDLWIDADATRICQVLANLLTNAAKYTQRHGAIDVRAWRDGDEAVVTIRDNGMGVSRDLLPILFDLFVQGRRTLDRSEGGLGLGLAIVKNLVRIHGGRVAARSEGIGKGTELEVRLPALPAAYATTRIGTPDVAAATELEPAAASGKRVLVVDDNQDAAELLADVLDSLGYQARTAFDGPSALDIDAEFAPEIAVLDIGLPVMDGYELARRLRERASPSRPLRLIALTGYGTASDRARTAAAGFDAHVVKPLDLASLESVLQA
jgi:signal transduction histidine kinase